MPEPRDPKTDLNDFNVKCQILQEYIDDCNKDKVVLDKKYEKHEKTMIRMNKVQRIFNIFMATLVVLYCIGVIISIIK